MKKADAKTEAEVRAVLDAWAKAYDDHDVEGIMALVAPDEYAIFIGTEAHEKNIGPHELRDAIEHDIARLETISITMPWLSVLSAGEVAWAVGDCICDLVAEGHEIHLDARQTVILEKRGDKWLVVHSHLSVPEAA